MTVKHFDEHNKYEIRRMVGMVLQNPDNQLVSTIVEEDVAFGPENLGLEPDEIVRRVHDALSTVGMLDYREHARTSCPEVKSSALQLPEYSQCSPMPCARRADCDA